MADAIDRIADTALRIDPPCPRERFVEAMRHLGIAANQADAAYSRALARSHAQDLLGALFEARHRVAANGSGAALKKIDAVIMAVTGGHP